jgi:hypothetical protein
MILAIRDLHEDTLVVEEEERVNLVQNLTTDGSENFEGQENISRTVALDLAGTVTPTVSAPALHVESVIGHVAMEVCVGLNLQDVGVDSVAYLAREGEK